MSRLFLNIYDWFQHHTKAFYALLVAVVVACAVMASQIRMQENITNFFNEEKSAIFDNVKAADKIVVMLSGENLDAIIESATIFEEELNALEEDGLLNSITTSADEDVIERCISFVYDYLPIFLTEEDYTRIEAQISKSGIDKAVANAYEMISSASGAFVGDVVMRDPLGVGTHILQKFEQLNPDLQYEIYEGRLFTHDLATMLMFVEPSNSMGDTGSNDELVSRLEAAEARAEISGVKIECLGGPIIAVYNARQIKRDTVLTLALALVIILTVILFSFRNRWSIPFIVVPPAFGALFALAMVWLVQGEISAIAIGAGTIVLGVSLSYSIHIVSHLNHISSPREIIEELATPLTIGCFTTIGAFASLMFTSSALLQDMGLFDLFALIGTTIFSLVFIPHFLKGMGDTTKSPTLNAIERAVGYRYDGNKFILLPIVVAAVVALFFYNDVEFDDDMSHINYMPEHIVAAESRSVEIFGDESNDVYIVTGNSDFNRVTAEYAELNILLEELRGEGSIAKFVTISDFIVPMDEQNRRIARWNDFWAKHKQQTIADLTKSANRYGFRSGAFSRFEESVTRNYTPCRYSSEEIGAIPAISEWINSSNGATSLFSRISLDKEQKESVYAKIDNLKNSIVVDRGFFSSKMVEATSNDFNYILLVSSLIVFIALYVSYGRLELALLTFLPMAISWVIILGMMAIFGIKFNIVNIILATLIFGLGDDFSIFIMDGLLQEYKNGKSILGTHKTAIFFSAFTAIVGMGVLIFAQHPALKSIALISVLGLSVVVLVAYTIQPMLFRLLVTSPIKRGGVPYTLFSILNTIYSFVYFLVGCILLQIAIVLLIPIPIKRTKKKLIFHKMVYYFTRFFLSTLIGVKTKRVNPHNEKYEKPAVIIANHQSFADIILLLSTTPKIVMVTNSWVWNSPFFGWIVKYLDFHHSGDGYERLAENLKESIDEGYSVVVFPEGTRSADCSILRFHKGAFYLAQLLKVDTLPMLIYGAGQVSSKRQPFHINSGILATKTLKRVAYCDTSFGETYQEQAKNYRKFFIEQYSIFSNEFRRKDHYFRNMLLRNYTYKGFMLKGYMPVKCHIDGFYYLWDKVIPRNAVVTDIGCGYGQMSYMLGMLAPEREVVGIDYDADKIDLANCAFLGKRCNVRFVCADMREVEIPQSDAILFNDSLHYVDAESQDQILQRAVASLNDGGMIMVRDGDNSQSAEAHGRIEKTEVWSTRILKFNKVSQALTFVSTEWMQHFAERNNLDINIRSCDKSSSEVLYILTKRK